jgi:small subunit ribosomal protein S6
MVSEKVTIEENTQLNSYELVLIINPEVLEEKFEAVIENISRYIAGKGGVVSETQRWGKRKLAYPIKHFMEGSYVLSQFKLEPEFCKELEASLRISEEVLRHLLIKLDS